MARGEKMKPEDKAVKAIEEDILDRRGIGDEWSGIDQQTLREIRKTWRGIIRRAFAVAPKSEARVAQNGPD